MVKSITNLIKNGSESENFNNIKKKMGEFSPRTVLSPIRALSDRRNDESIERISGGETNQIYRYNPNREPSAFCSAPDFNQMGHDAHRKN